MYDVHRIRKMYIESIETHMSNMDTKMWGKMLSPFVVRTADHVKESSKRFNSVQTNSI